MQNGDERGVRISERVLRRSVRGLPDWEGAHLFLELVRRKSFRAAADRLGISVNALRARVSDFERSLGVTLVTRHVDGVRATEEGERVAELVEEMERTSFEMLRVCEPPETSLTGEVRLAITEGLGAVWIGSKLVEFERLHPHLMVDVHATMHSADVLRLESDIAVQLTRPTAQDLKVVKLGRLHFLPFAAQSYLDRHGTPTSLAELGSGHRLVLQTDDDESWHDLYNRIFPGIPPEQLIAQRSNISSVNYSAVVNGGGIGVLPTYVYAMGAPIIPLAIPLYNHVDIWMTYHESASGIPRVRKLCDWLIEAFSPRLYPWFRDEFIPPEELRRKHNGVPTLNPLDICSPPAAMQSPRRVKAKG